MITLLAALALSPFWPGPGPDPVNPVQPGFLLPTYVTNGDGTRWQCSPGMYQCQPSSDGLPSYLVPS